MYKVLLVFDNYELLNELQKLHIWGTCSEFEISAVFRDGLSAYRELKRNHYDLVITEIRITGMDGLQILRSVKREQLCSHVVLCSEFSDFDYARQGIILGAFDYMVKPLKPDLFLTMFNRIKNENYVHMTSELYYGDEVLTYFQNHDNGIYGYLSKMIDKIYDEAGDYITADKMIRQIYENIIEGIFEQNEWLDLYLAQQDFYNTDGICEGNPESYKLFYQKNIFRLYEIYCELYPTVNNEQIERALIYILNNPESELKQKDLAARMYMNTSYFSTVFGTHTELRFVDYLVNVRMYRAAYLLQKSSLKIVEIAERLSYKDTGYFSRLFKKKFGVTPSEYKVTEESMYYGGII